MSEWRETTLGNVAKIQTGPFGSQLKNEQYITGGTPVVTVEHINNFRVVDFDYPSVTDEDKTRLSRYTLDAGDIVFTRVGSVDLSAYIQPHQKGWMFSSRMLRVRPNEQLDARYLSYFFQQKSFRENLLSIAVGATMPSINTEILEGVSVIYPPLPEQKSIAAVLGSLDDKIDLLHRQNQTLEAMAATLFRQWFVEEAGEDWEEVVLSDLVTITRGASPRPIIEYVKGGTVPWIKIADATGSSSFYIDSTNEFIIEAGVPKSVEVFPGDLILSNSATCGLPYFVEIYGCIHDGWLLFRDFKGVSKYFVFFFLKQINNELNHVADGSVQNNLNTAILKNYPLRRPSNEALKAYDNAVEPIIIKMKSNNRQIRTLEKLRDTLLPKLMSGEVRVA